MRQQCFGINRLCSITIEIEKKETTCPMTMDAKVTARLLPLPVKRKSS